MTAHLGDGPRHTIHKYLISFGIMITLLVVNVFMWQVTRSQIYNASRDTFMEKVHGFNDMAKDTARSYLTISLLGHALYDANADLDRKEFTSFFTEILAREKFYTGVTNIFFAESAPSAEGIASHVRGDTSVSGVGYPSFRIFPDATTPLAVVNYMVPASDSQTYFGYNISADPHQRDSLIRSMTNDSPIATDRTLFLNQERIAVYQSVYTGPSKKRTLRGFIVTLIDPDIFFQNLVNTGTSGVHLQIYKGMLTEQEIAGGSAYYTNHEVSPLASPTQSDYRIVSHLDFAGQPFTLVYSSSEREQMTWAQKMLLNTLLYGGGAVIVVLFLVLNYILFAEHNSEWSAVRVSARTP